MKTLITIWGKQVFSLFFFTILLLVQDANANQDKTEKTDFIIFGPAFTAEYMGSDDYEPVPMLVSQFDIGSFEFEIEGLRAQVSLLSFGRWKSGVTLELDTGRDKDVENESVSKMEEIEFAANMGAFMSYDASSKLLTGDNLEFKLSAYGDSTGVHDGAYATVGVTYTLPLYIPWRFEFDMETTFADAKYMDTYFGVSDKDAAAGGLSRYQAGGSFRDITFTAKTLFFFSPKWGLFSRLSVAKLLGDAADSPITTEGSEYQYFAGFGLFYRF